MKKFNILLIPLLMFAWTQTVQANFGKSRNAFAVYFDQNAATPRSESLGTLETIKVKLSDDRHLKALIEGYSDTSEARTAGPRTTLYDLSRSRAEFVARWLESSLGGSFIKEIKSYGSTRTPGRRSGLSGLFASASNNRRVDVTLLAANTASSDQNPTVFFPEMEYSFKDVYDGEEVLHDFVIRNKGNVPLDILNVNPG